MNDGESHEIMGVELEGGVSTEDVSVDTVRSGLQSKDDNVRNYATTVTAALAREDPEAAVSLRESLFDALESDKRLRTLRATEALEAIANEHPSQIESAVPRLAAQLESELPAIRTSAARALGHAGVESPALLTAHVEPLLAATNEEPDEPIEADVLEDTDLNRSQRDSLNNINKKELQRHALTREITINLLVEVADNDPDALKPHVPEVIDALSSSNVHVISSAADLLSLLAQDDPAAVDDAVDALVGLLDHEDTAVVASAVTALGFVSDPETVPALQGIVDDEERNDDLRDLAARTAEFIDE